MADQATLTGSGWEPIDIAHKDPTGAERTTLATLLAGESQSLGLMFTADGGTEYETVAASQTTQVLGTVGAAGDLLSRLICVVTTAATAQVQIKDGSDTAITVFPNSPGGGVGTYTIPIGLLSRTGAWQVTTGAGVAVIACGNFS
jgi:hypothetical protein